MLVALTGPQGGGKSTLAEYYQNLGFPIITRKTARSILGEWGVTLHDVNNSFDLSLKFQEEVIKRKHEDEMEAISDKNRVWFIERSYTDVFAYTLVNFGKNNEYNDWLNKYYERCCEYQRYYTAVVYIPGGFFPIRDDGVRGINQHYGKMVDLLMDHYVRKMTPEKRLHFVNQMDLDARVQDIGNFVKYVAQNDPKVYD